MSKLMKNWSGSFFEGINPFGYVEALHSLWKKLCPVLTSYACFAAIGSFGSWVTFVNQRWMTVTRENIWLYWGCFFALSMTFLIGKIFSQLSGPRGRQSALVYWGRVVATGVYLLIASGVMGAVTMFGVGLLLTGWQNAWVLHLLAGAAMTAAGFVILSSFVLPVMFGMFYFINGESFRLSMLRGGHMLWHHWTYLVGLGIYNYILQLVIHFVLGMAILLLQNGGLDIRPFLPSVEWHAVGIANLFYVGVLYLFFTKKKRYITVS